MKMAVCVLRQESAPAIVPENRRKCKRADACYTGYGGTRLTGEEADCFVGLYEFFYILKLYYGAAGAGTTPSC